MISPRLVNELQTRTGTHYSPTVSRSRGTPRIIVQDAFIGGSAQADQLSTENHIHTMRSLCRRGTTPSKQASLPRTSAAGE